MAKVKTVSRVKKNNGVRRSVNLSTCVICLDSVYVGSTSCITTRCHHNYHLWCYALHIITWFFQHYDYREDLQLRGPHEAGLARVKEYSVRCPTCNREGFATALEDHLCVRKAWMRREFTQEMKLKIVREYEHYIRCDLLEPLQVTREHVQRSRDRAVVDMLQTNYDNDPLLLFFESVFVIRSELHGLIEATVMNEIVRRRHQSDRARGRAAELTLDYIRSTLREFNYYI